MTSPITSDNLKILIENHVADHSKKAGVKNIWRTPLSVTAKADDRFDILPHIAADDHALPRDLLSSAKSVIVFFVPFKKELAKKNHNGDIPCREWGLAYKSTNNLINSLCDELESYLKKAGYKSALVPATHNFDHHKLMARWSHKHLAFISGLGRFGVNAQFITPSGCTGRLGSLITEAEFDNTPLVGETELCLSKNGNKCLICVKRCPVGAISKKKGIDRKKCWARLQKNLHESKELAGLNNNTHVCGKCQVLLPCSLRIPPS